ncbi:MAG: S8 family serine peptidase [Thermoflexales bacterium]|nr:S8 family serine peptidase [Thermoflexales bacterium]
MFNTQRYAHYISGLVLFLLLASSGAATAGPGAPPQQEPPPAQATLDKIAPWVLEHTPAGAQAEFLVVLAEQADLRHARQLGGKLEKGRYVRDVLWEKARASQAPLLEWLVARGIEHRSYYIVNMIWVKADRSVALALASRPDVARVEANPQIANLESQVANSKAQLEAERVSHPPFTRIENDGSVSLETSYLKPETVFAIAGVEPGIAYVGAPEVWAMGYSGQGIVIGGQDTGYDWDHPALKAQYRGWDGATASHDYNWHDSIHAGGSTCGADSPQPCDDHSHGTHTMGTAVGSDSANNQIGMAPGAQWIGCRNMNQGVGTPATYLECFEFFLAPYPIGGTPAQGDAAKAPDVTINSWTCPPSEGCAWGILQSAVEAQRAAGIMTVVSAGNAGSGCSTVTEPPAIYDAAYTVGALNTGSDTIASFSSRGPVTIDGSSRAKPDIAAPGTDTRSSLPGTGYGLKSGTSMAGPHVAGAVALLWSARPEIKNQIDATEHILNQTAHPIASTACSSAGWPNNVYGHGRLDVKASVERALTPLTWSGAASSDWDVAANWTPARAPDYTDNVIIPGSLPITATWPAITGTAACHNLTLQAGARLSLVGQSQLTVGGVVSNSGSLIQTRPVEVTGKAVEFTAIGDGANNSRYLGLVITPTASMGDVQVSVRGNQSCGDNGTQLQAVQRCYEISPTHSVAATITFYYSSVEANGNLTPTVYHWNESGHEWEALNPTLNGSQGDALWVQAVVSDYSPFSLKNSPVPTTITLRTVTQAGSSWLSELRRWIAQFYKMRLN